MLLEEKVVEILREDISRAEKHIKWNGMYDKTAEKIVKMSPSDKDDILLDVIMEGLTRMVKKDK